MPATESAPTASQAGAETSTAAKPSPDSTKPSAPAGGMAKIGEALERALSSGTDRSTANPVDEAPGGEGEGQPADKATGTDPDADGAAAGDDDPEAGGKGSGEAAQPTWNVPSQHRSLLEGSELTEDDLRQMPAESRTRVLNQLQRERDRFNGLQGAFRQLKGGNNGSPDADPDRQAPNASADTAGQRAGKGAGRSDSASTTIPKLDLNAIRDKLVLDLGEETANTVLENFGKPLQYLLDKAEKQEENDRMGTLANYAESADKFFNSEDAAGLYGKSHETASKEQRESRIAVARKAMKLLTSGAATDWPSAVRDAHFATHAQTLIQRAKGDVTSQLTRRAGRTAPRITSAKAGAPPSRAASGIDKIVDALGPILDRGSSDE